MNTIKSLITRYQLASVLILTLVVVAGVAFIVWNYRRRARARR